MALSLPASAMSKNTTASFWHPHTMAPSAAAGLPFNSIDESRFVRIKTPAKVGQSSIVKLEMAVLSIVCATCSQLTRQLPEG